MDVGFNPDNALTVTVDTNMGRYTEETGRQFFGQVVERIGAIPGVRAAGITAWLPLGLSSSDSYVEVAGYDPADKERMSLYNTSVAGDFFEAMDIPVLEGRVFDDRDTAESTRVAVINEVMARRYWKGGSPIGRSFRSQGQDWQVIGVVKSGKVRTLKEAPEPVYYMPMSQHHSPEAALVVRSEIDSAAIAAPVLQELSRIDRTLPYSDLRTLHQHLGLVFLPAKFLGVLMGAFGALALVLALVGVYGVMAHSVSQRTQEFGVRAALGAQRGELVGLVLRRGLGITLIGCALGLLAAFGATRALQNLLHGISTLDPVTFGAVTVLLVAVALLACYVPARRASRVDPMNALRYE
jgi:predicted permease